MHTYSAEPDMNRLFAIAEAQAGYFTAAQATTAGYSRSLVAYHAKAGTFDRVQPGVYRLTRYPGSPREDLYVAWLKAGPRAVISHESALELYGLSDLMPSEVHVTMPRTSSRRRAGVRMHTTRLDEGDVSARDGLPVTTVPRTIADVASRGGSPEIVGQAVQEALERGLTTEAELEDQADRRGGRPRSLIMPALKRWRES